MPAKQTHLNGERSALDVVFSGKGRSFRLQQRMLDALGFSDDL